MDPGNRKGKDRGDEVKEGHQALVEIWRNEDRDIDDELRAVEDHVKDEIRKVPCLFKRDRR